MRAGEGFDIAQSAVDDCFLTHQPFPTDLRQFRHAVLLLINRGEVRGNRGEQPVRGEGPHSPFRVGRFVGGPLEILSHRVAIGRDGLRRLRRITQPDLRDISSQQVQFHRVGPGRLVRQHGSDSPHEIRGGVPSTTEQIDDHRRVVVCRVVVCRVVVCRVVLHGVGPFTLLREGFGEAGERVHQRQFLFRGGVSIRSEISSGNQHSQRFALAGLTAAVGGDDLHADLVARF